MIEVEIEFAMRTRLCKLQEVGNVWNSPRNRERGVGWVSRGRKYESKVDGGYKPTFSPLKKCSLKSHSALQLSFYFIFSFFPHVLFLFSSSSTSFGGHRRWNTHKHTHTPPHSPANVRFLTPEEEKKKKKRGVREKREAREEEEEEQG